MKKLIITVMMMGFLNQGALGSGLQAKKKVAEIINLPESTALDYLLHNEPFQEHRLLDF